MRVNHLNLLILWNFGLVMVRSYCYQNPVISMNKNIAENLEMPETKQNTYSYTMYIYLDETTDVCCGGVKNAGGLCAPKLFLWSICTCMYVRTFSPITQICWSRRMFILKLNQMLNPSAAHAARNRSRSKIINNLR